jgi:hypothetical protein
MLRIGGEMRLSRVFNAVSKTLIAASVMLAGGPNRADVNWLQADAIAGTE